MLMRFVRGFEMSKQNNSSFNDFLVRLGEKPLSPIAGDVSEEVLSFEISELEDKYGLSHEVDDKEAQNAENIS